VRVNFDLVKKKTLGALTATIVGEGGDIKVSIDEDRVPPQFTMTYADLGGRLAARYSDFKRNDKYHKIRRPLEKNKSLCWVRVHNPQSKKSATTRFYNPNIIQHFDKHYTLKAPLKAATGKATQVASVFD
jgi:hypothetical protein